tara:strand:+ start:277 stop:930 length:654 start_codon:yes stop_codon:yes gene_type:complete
LSLKALIPVRAGSQRVINKNVRSFAGSNLLEIKINQLKLVPDIDEIYVSSDCRNMLDIAEKNNVTALERDPTFATSDVPMNNVYEYLAKEIDCEHVLYTNATSPLTEISTYRSCIEKYLSLTEYESLNTVTSLKENLWLDGKPINYDPDNHPRSQDLPNIVFLNFAINIIPRDLMISRRNIVGKKFYPYLLNKTESIDIDDEDDFIIAEAVYNAKKR